MFQTIHETVKVAGIFQKTSFKPVWFVWQNRQFKIKDITLVSEVKEGKIKKKIYSVLAQDNLYRLDYFISTQNWKLESVWIDD